MAKKNDTILKKTDLNLLMQRDLPEDSPSCDIDINDFCSGIKRLCTSKKLYFKNDLGDKLSPFIDELQKHKKNELFRRDSQYGTFWLVEKYENLLFKTLLGDIKSETIFKYTNVHAIIYTSKNEQAMTSVVGMNDATECMYADVYLKGKGYNRYLGDDAYTLFGSKAFITSFTTKKDDLTMWRLYGDDAKGIAYEYDFDIEKIPENFFLAPVSYANECGVHKELDFIMDMSQLEINKCKFSFKNLYIWKYFFKPKEYSVEDEVRLLFFSSELQDKSEWIETSTGMVAPMKKFLVEDRNNDYDEKKMQVYPLNVKSIWLGPRMSDMKANEDNIKQLVKEVFGWSNIDTRVKTSTIQNYRESKE